MTFSLIALDPDNGCLGMACATGSPAVGGFVLHLWPGVGAAITQGYSTHVLAAEQGLARLAIGESVHTVVSALRQADQGASWRQLAIMDVQGSVAGWTGECNLPFMDMHLVDGLVVAGNMLASNRVVPVMVTAFHEARSRGEPMAESLLASLAAGRAEGGDQRGAVSAALKVRCPGGVPYDLRIDNDAEAVLALERLHRQIRGDQDFQTFLARLPDATDPHRH
ncbi:DUF1028 domain-containing protein [Vreelandella arcis]|uniref:Uncharacterized conserved protein, Ntn-hydrolase superfamily n=1 Tax=Vreelandella arcis TaxID=416873 RepID=A0A1G9XCQ2_9GAMM|nr:DUF1028 domain-containing protein [Halomonas arcis]SDM94226.1 Uncharacterized conserved protein, Ntn-hydrolase superfamily [Halomonas arcis]